ncbi:MAG: hypothetical protein IKC64_02485, partial [Clostridia bacterium]|nr:hypothetical protein [Clostridia bacterium]
WLVVKPCLRHTEPAEVSPWAIRSARGISHCVRNDGRSIGRGWKSNGVCGRGWWSSLVCVIPSLPRYPLGLFVLLGGFLTAFEMTDSPLVVAGGQALLASYRACRGIPLGYSFC